jgi:D-alanyl-D-alanine carboxypeptidase
MKNSIVAGVLAVALIGAAFGVGAVVASLPSHSQTAAVADAQTLPPIVLDPSQLTAEAAIIYDPETGQVLYQKNANTALPLASLTKLMTAQAVLASRDPSTLVTFTAEDLAPDGDWGFKVGDTTDLGDLLRFGLVASSNDAMAAAASSLGSGYLDDMNSIAQTLNLTKTYFLNPTGLDLNSDTAGAYGSAFDIARLLAEFYKKYPALIEHTTSPTVSIVVNGRTLTSAATAAPLQNIPGFAGGKTGFTDLAGGNLAAVFDLEINHPLVFVVMHSTETGRFADIRTLLEAARSAEQLP